MSEPTIHVIPAEYYGGGGPKIEKKKKEEKRVSQPSAGAPSALKEKVSHRKLLVISAVVLFVLVIAVATWYYTRGLRQEPAAAPREDLVVETPVQPEPEPESKPEPEIPLPPPPPPPPSPPQLSIDRDNDELSAAEEELYRSGVSDPDTDKDGFLDGHEVINLYNPSGIAPERLEAAGLAARFNNSEFDYDLLLPRGWTTLPSVEGSRVITVRDTNGTEIFEIGVIANIEALSLANWYESQAPGAPGVAGAAAWTSNKSGWQGLMQPDRTKVYFGQGDQIYTIGYLPAARTEELLRQYRTTFGMMLNSFKIM